MLHHSGLSVKILWDSLAELMCAPMWHKDDILDVYRRDNFLPGNGIALGQPLTWYGIENECQGWFEL